MEVFGLITAWEVMDMGLSAWEVVKLLVAVGMQGLVTAVVVGHLLVLLEEKVEFVETETELVEAAVDLSMEFVEAELVAALRA